jgi:hypothetical protein
VRARFALLVALGAALFPAAAEAGQYEVYSCGGPAGAAQNAFVPSADVMMSAYSICPPSSGVGTGIVTKASSNGGVAPNGYGAYQVFVAPPGASLANVSFTVGAIRLSYQWTVGIVAYDAGDFFAGDYPFGCYPWTSYCGIGTPVFSIPATVNLYSHGRFRFETRCVSASGCDLSASGFSPANRALFSAANVTVRVQDWSPPNIVPHHGALWSGGWHRGYEEAWSSYTDNVGIMITRLFVDGVPVQVQDYRDQSWPDWVRCNFTRPRPCVDVQPGGLSIESATVSDGPHTMRVEAVDAAGNVAALERRIDVDNTPPGKAAGPTVEGGDQWRSANDFAVRWGNPGGQVAPIVRVHYRICPLSGGPCTDASEAGEGIERIAGLAVSGPGEYTLRLWLEDAAGNRDADRASDLVYLRFDDEAPVGLFEPPDPERPTRVAVAVADRGSGVASAVLEIKGAGQRHWLELDGSFDGGRLVAEMDDLALPDGVYELRARLRDRAGNERTTDRRQDGSKMQLTLPLRLSSRVVLAADEAPARCRTRRPARRRPCRARRTGATEIRGSGLVRGRLESRSGAPIPRAAVTISEQLRTGGGFVHRATLVADALGRFAYPIGPGASRAIRFHYRGTALVKPTTSEVRVLVPARSSITVDRRRLSNGQKVRFRGALRGGYVPRGGKLIDLQAYYRGGWRTFATPRTDARGRWGYRYRFGATRGIVRYRFRARVRAEAAYPFELGYSRVVRVTVRG